MNLFRSTVFLPVLMAFFCLTPLAKGQSNLFDEAEESDVGSNDDFLEGYSDGETSHARSAWSLRGGDVLGGRQLAARFQIGFPGFDLELLKDLGSGLNLGGGFLLQYTGVGAYLGQSTVLVLPYGHGRYQLIDRGRLTLTADGNIGLGYAGFAAVKAFALQFSVGCAGSYRVQKNMSAFFGMHFPINTWILSNSSAATIWVDLRTGFEYFIKDWMAVYAQFDLGPEFYANHGSRSAGFGWLLMVGIEVDLRAL